MFVPVPLPAYPGAPPSPLLLEHSTRITTSRRRIYEEIVVLGLTGGPLLAAGGIGAGGSSKSRDFRRLFISASRPWRCSRRHCSRRLCSHQPRHARIQCVIRRERRQTC